MALYNTNTPVPTRSPKCLPAAMSLDVTPERGAFLSSVGSPTPTRPRNSPSRTPPSDPISSANSPSPSRAAAPHHYPRGGQKQQPQQLSLPTQEFRNIGGGPHPDGDGDDDGLSTEHRSASNTVSPSPILVEGTARGRRSSSSSSPTVVTTNPSHATTTKPSASRATPPEKASRANSPVPAAFPTAAAAAPLQQRGSGDRSSSGSGPRGMGTVPTPSRVFDASQSASTPSQPRTYRALTLPLSGRTTRGSLHSSGDSPALPGRGGGGGGGGGGGVSPALNTATTNGISNKSDMSVLARSNIHLSQLVDLLDKKVFTEADVLLELEAIRRRSLLTSAPFNLHLLPILAWYLLKEMFGEDTATRYVAVLERPYTQAETAQARTVASTGDGGGGTPVSPAVGGMPSFLPQVRQLNKDRRVAEGTAQANKAAVYYNSPTAAGDGEVGVNAGSPATTAPSSARSPRRVQPRYSILDDSGSLPVSPDSHQSPEHRRQLQQMQQGGQQQQQRQQQMSPKDGRTRERAMKALGIEYSHLANSTIEEGDRSGTNNGSGGGGGGKPVRAATAQGPPRNPFEFVEPQDGPAALPYPPAWPPQLRAVEPSGNDSNIINTDNHNTHNRNRYSQSGFDVSSIHVQAGGVSPGEAALALATAGDMAGWTANHSIINAISTIACSAFPEVDGTSVMPSQASLALEGFVGSKNKHGDEGTVLAAGKDKKKGDSAAAEYSVFNWNCNQLASNNSGNNTATPPTATARGSQPRSSASGVIGAATPYRMLHTMTFDERAATEPTYSLDCGDGTAYGSLINPTEAEHPTTSSDNNSAMDARKSGAAVAANGGYGSLLPDVTVNDDGNSRSEMSRSSIAGATTVSLLPDASQAHHHRSSSGTGANSGPGYFNSLIHGRSSVGGSGVGASSSAHQASGASALWHAADALRSAMASALYQSQSRASSGSGEYSYSGGGGGDQYSAASGPMHSTNAGATAIDGTGYGSMMAGAGATATTTTGGGGGMDSSVAEGGHGSLLGPGEDQYNEAQDSITYMRDRSKAKSASRRKMTAQVISRNNTNANNSATTNGSTNDVSYGSAMRSGAQGGGSGGNSSRSYSVFDNSASGTRSRGSVGPGGTSYNDGGSLMQASSSQHHHHLHVVSHSGTLTDSSTTKSNGTGGYGQASLLAMSTAQSLEGSRTQASRSHSNTAAAGYGSLINDINNGGGTVNGSSSANVDQQYSVYSRNNSSPNNSTRLRSGDYGSMLAPPSGSRDSTTHTADMSAMAGSSHGYGSLIGGSMNHTSSNSISISNNGYSAIGMGTDMSGGGYGSALRLSAHATTMTTMTATIMDASVAGGYGSLLHAGGGNDNGNGYHPSVHMSAGSGGNGGYGSVLEVPTTTSVGSGGGHTMTATNGSAGGYGSMLAPSGSNTSNDDSDNTKNCGYSVLDETSNRSRSATGRPPTAGQCSTNQSGGDSAGGYGSVLELPTMTTVAGKTRNSSSNGEGSRGGYGSADGYGSMLAPSCSNTSNDDRSAASAATAAAYSMMNASDASSAASNGVGGYGSALELSREAQERSAHIAYSLMRSMPEMKDLSAADKAAVAGNTQVQGRVLALARAFEAQHPQQQEFQQQRPACMPQQQRQQQKPQKDYSGFCLYRGMADGGGGAKGDTNGSQFGSSVLKAAVESRSHAVFELSSATLERLARNRKKAAGGFVPSPPPPPPAQQPTDHSMVNDVVTAAAGVRSGDSSGVGCSQSMLADAFKRLDLTVPDATVTEVGHTTAAKKKEEDSVVSAVASDASGYTGMYDAPGGATFDGSVSGGGGDGSPTQPQPSPPTETTPKAAAYDRSSRFVAEVNGSPAAEAKGKKGIGFRQRPADGNGDLAPSATPSPRRQRRKDNSSSGGGTARGNDVTVLSEPESSGDNLATAATPAGRARPAMNGDFTVLQVGGSGSSPRRMSILQPASILADASMLNATARSPQARQQQKEKVEKENKKQSAKATTGLTTMDLPTDFTRLVLGGQEPSRALEQPSIDIDPLRSLPLNEVSHYPRPQRPKSRAPTAVEDKDDIPDFADDTTATNGYDDESEDVTPPRLKQATKSPSPVSDRANRAGHPADNTPKSPSPMAGTGGRNGRPKEPFNVQDISVFNMSIDHYSRCADLTAILTHSRVEDSIVTERKRHNNYRKTTSGDDTTAATDKDNDTTASDEDDDDTTAATVDEGSTLLVVARGPPRRQVVVPHQQQPHLHRPAHAPMPAPAANGGGVNPGAYIGMRPLKRTAFHVPNVVYVATPEVSIEMERRASSLKDKAHDNFVARWAARGLALKKQEQQAQLYEEAQRRRGGGAAPVGGNNYQRPPLYPTQQPQQQQAAVARRRPANPNGGPLPSLPQAQPRGRR